VNNFQNSKLDLDSIKSQIVISQFAVDKLGCHVTNKKTMCCHLHHEKTPSLNFNDDKGFYYCFGCHRSGDVFSLTQEIKHLSFLEAIQFVAKTVGISIENDYGLLRNSNISKEKKEILLEIVEKTCSFFEKNLKINHSFIDYLKQRNISDEVINKFRLGYAENDDSRLLSFLKEKYQTNFSILLDSGLFKKTRYNNNFFNILHDRLIFPIFDKFGSVIAFGGRVTASAKEDDRPKYLNCSDSLIFKKSENLYGLNFARQEIKAQNTVLVVEGYMDVLALFTHGFKNVVAPLGTAVSQDQIEILWSVADHIKCVFDGDVAGVKAGVRLGEKALSIIKPGKTISFVRMPKGKDPADLMDKSSISHFEQALEKAIPLPNYLFLLTAGKYKVKTVDSIAIIKKHLIDLLRLMNDRILMNEYAEFFKKSIHGMKNEISQKRKQILQNNVFDSSFKMDLNQFERIFITIIVMMFIFPEDSESFVKNDIINFLYEKAQSRQKLENMLCWAQVSCKSKNLETFKNKFSSISEIIDGEVQKIRTLESSISKDLIFLKQVELKIKMLTIKEEKNRARLRSNLVDLVRITQEEKEIKKIINDIFSKI
jgi:DNA primase